MAGLSSDVSTAQDSRNSPGRPPRRNWADVKASWPLVLGAGLFLYGGLAGLVNQTRLTLNAERVRLAHAPLPFPGGVDLPRSQVETFRVIESGGTRVNNSTTRRSWTVEALTRKGGPRTLYRFYDGDKKLAYRILEELLGFHTRIG